jgi:hypothetical protein
MRKKHSAQSAFFRQRALPVFGIVCSIATGTLLAFFRPEAPAKSSQRTLAFAERAAYQRTIEEV